MLLTPAASPPTGQDWLFQVKWDGVRNLTLAEGGQVRHWSRRLRERSPLFPEFAGLAAVLGGRRTVLDGEIIVLRAGRPSFAGILERDVAVRLDRRKLTTAPATLMLFDLLEYGEQALYNLPLHERLSLLEQVLPPGDHWLPVTSFPSSAGAALFAEAGRTGLEGVVAKRRASRYMPGVRSKEWLKVKQKRRMLAVVCGYTSPVGRPGGLLLGAYHQGRLRYIGRVGSGISGADLAALRAALQPSDRPFDYEPSLRDRFAGPPGPVIWTAPRLTVLVEFSEWTEEGRLRHPVVVGYSTEPPEAAQVE